ncbi:hypothetical protein GTW56_30260 [Bacillus sp. EB93]|nr:hypothetical protein [Peribacillus frigoritolerans]
MDEIDVKVNQVIKKIEEALNTSRLMVKLSQSDAVVVVKCWSWNTSLI